MIRAERAETDMLPVLFSLMIGSASLPADQGCWSRIVVPADILEDAMCHGELISLVRGVCSSGTIDVHPGWRTGI